MYFYDQQYDRSAKSFKELFLAGEKGREVLIPKVWLDLEFANDLEAIQSVEEYVKEHQDSLDAREYLGTLYDKAGRPFDYLQNLEEIYRLNPSTEVLLELKQLYADMNNPKSQMGALNTLIEEQAATIADYRTLAQLYAAKGEPGVALNIIDRLLERYKPEDFDEETVYFTTDFLINHNKKLEAFLIASAYVGKHPDLNTVVNLGIKFANAGYIPEAEFMLGLLSKEDREKPKAVELELNILIDRRREREAFALLLREFEKNKLPPAFYVDLMKRAKEREYKEVVDKMFDVLNFDDISDRQMITMIDLFLSRGDVEDAKRLENNLGEEYLETHPVFRIGLMFLTEGKKNALEELKLDKDFTVDERLELARLVSSVNRSLAVTLLEPVTSLESVDPDLLDSVGELYIELGLTDRFENMLADYEIPPGFRRSTYLRAQTYVLAARGESDELFRRLQAYDLGNSDTLRTLFIIAERNQHPELELRIARALVSKREAPVDELLLARAYAANGKTQKALEIVRKIEKQGINVQDTYFYVYMLGAKSNETYLGELNEFIDRAIQQKVGEKKLRQYAFTLVDHKFKPEAEKILVVTAKGKPFESGDTQTLLDIWGKELTPKQMDWVVTEATGTEGDDLAGWVGYLLYNGHPAEAATIAAGSDWKHPEVAFLYIEALQLSNQRDKLATVLTELIDSDVQDVSLLKLGTLAQELDLFDQAELAYQRVLAVNPEDADALKGIGMTTFVRSRYWQSLDYFERYLCTDNPDYLGYYYTGEIYWLYQHYKVAQMRFYPCAMQMLLEKEELNVYQKATLAQLYFRMRDPGTAILLYHEILEEQPHNVAFLTEFANMFIDLEKWCCAEEMLNRIDMSKETELDEHSRYLLERNADIARFRLYKTMREFRTANCFVNHLLEKYPDEPRIVGLKGEIEREIGHDYTAMDWFECAHEMDPDNDVFPQQWRDVLYDHYSFLQADREDLWSGSFQYESRYNVIWQQNLNRHVAVRFGVGTDEMRLFNAVNFWNSTNFKFWDARVRGEVAANAKFKNGVEAEVSAYFSHQTPGAGLYLYRKDSLGDAWARIRYHHATWDFTQTIIWHGVEDRFQLMRTLNFKQYLTLFGGGGPVWYHLKDVQNAAATYVVQAGLFYRIPRYTRLVYGLGQDGDIFFNYALDAQYVASLKRIINNVGQIVTPMDIQSRETHTMSLLIIKPFTRCFRFEGLFGGSYDRLSDGPVVPIWGASFFAGRKGHVEAALEYLHTRSTQFADESRDRVIGTIRMNY